MKTNLYGNRKALNALNSTLISNKGKYVFSIPLVASSTVEGHFRIDYIKTEASEFKQWEGALSEIVDPAAQAKIVENTKPVCKEIKDPWWVKVIRKIF